MRKTSATGTIGVVSVLALLIAVAAPLANDAPESPVSPADVRKLLEERRDVLAQLVDVNRRGYEQGEAAFEAVARARVALLNAELELTCTAMERIAIHQALFQTATELETAAQQKYQAGNGGLDDVLESKALRLRAHADLLNGQLTVGGKK